ncbi:hypothetical protein [Sphaerisporangium album]|nr:hypothetical protein [Sphaerisporangium album]
MDTSYLHTYQGNPPSRLIARSHNLSLIADLSPLTVGHLLLVSNRHYYSFSQIIRDHEHEVARFRAAIYTNYSATFGPPLIFEHGSTAEMDGSACITHAHWHFLPIDADSVDRIMTRDGLHGVHLSDMTRLADSAFSSAPYYYRSDDSDHMVYKAVHAMPRQYLRSVAAEVLGIPAPEWDWAVVVRKDAHRETMARTRSWRFENPAPT